MKEDKYLYGSLEAVSLGELLQIIRDKTVKINLKNTNESGYIHLHKNNIWDANFKGYSPKVSLCELIKLKEGNFNCEFDVIPLEKKLDKSIDQLLMEGLTMMDRANAFTKKYIYKNNKKGLNRKLMGVFGGIIFSAALATVYLTNPYNIVTNAEARLHCYYGKKATENKEYNEAIEEFSKAIMLNSNYRSAKISLGEVHTKIGLNYENIKNYTMALEEYEKGITFGSKTAVDAKYNLEDKIRKEALKKISAEKSAEETFREPFKKAFTERSFIKNKASAKDKAKKLKAGKKNKNKKR